MCTGAEAIAVASVVQGVSGYAQGKKQANIARGQAEQERMLAQITEQDYRRTQSRLYSEKRAAAGRSGVDMSTGSPMLAASDYAAEAELNALRIRAGGKINASRLEQQAGFYKQAGNMSLFQGAVRAGASLLAPPSFNDKPTPKTYKT